MNREQPAKQAAFQAVVMGSTPIRFTNNAAVVEWADTRAREARASAYRFDPCRRHQFAPVVQLAETMSLDLMRWGFESLPEYQFSGVGEGSFATVS